MRARKNGFALVTVLLFLIIAITAMAGLFSSVTTTYGIVGSREAQRIKGYYAAMAGLRYSIIMMEQTDVINNLNSSPYIATRHVIDNYPDLAADLEISAPHDVTITITRNGPSGGPYTYTVTSSYRL